MHSGHSMSQEILALHCTPFCSNTIDRLLVVAVLFDFAGKLQRNIQ